MIERVLVTMLLVFNEAKLSYFVKADTSAAKLEINQREYSNPYSIKKDLSKHLIEEDHSVAQELGNTLKNKQTSEANDRSRNKNPIQNSHDQDSIWQETEIIDIGIKDDIISASSHDVPSIPSKFIGPETKPYRPTKFRGIGPAGVDDYDKPSCDEFSRTARFNPYAVINEEWFSFYRWDSNHVPMVLEFIAPTSWEITSIREFLDKQVDSRQPINWDARKLIMNDKVYNISALLIERGDHGQFWMYPIRTNYTGLVEPRDVRFKQTADSRFIAMVMCRSDRAYIMSRVKEVPMKNDIPDAVASVGWRGRDGRSYLYTGSKWAPVPEMSEEEYWRPPDYHKEEALPPPPEIYDPEKDDVMIFGKKH